MLIKRPSNIKPSEITPQGIYVRRRELLKSAGWTVLSSSDGRRSLAWKYVQRSS